MWTNVLTRYHFAQLRPASLASTYLEVSGVDPARLVTPVTAIIAWILTNAKSTTADAALVPECNAPIQLYIHFSFAIAIRIFWYLKKLLSRVRGLVALVHRAIEEMGFTAVLLGLAPSITVVVILLPFATIIQVTTFLYEGSNISIVCIILNVLSNFGVLRVLSMSTRIHWQRFWSHGLYAQWRRRRRWRWQRRRSGGSCWRSLQPQSVRIWRLLGHRQRFPMYMPSRLRR